MSSTDRVRRWQARTHAKSMMFEEMDKLRRRSLESQFKKTICPPRCELLLAHVKQFFLAYPRCFTAPHSILVFDEKRVSCGFSHALNGWEYTAGILAIQSFDSSLIAEEVYVEDGAVMWRMVPDERYLEEAREEIEYLRELDLWGKNKRSTAAVTIVKGAR